jgi:hypothetical protein
LNSYKNELPLDVVVHTFNLSTGRQKQEEHKFEANLVSRYIRDLVSK